MKLENRGPNRPRRQYPRQTHLLTQYADLPSRILDINVNGGAWDVAPSGTYSATPHQNVGGVPDAIILQGEMMALIQLPDDMWNADNGLTYSWTLAGCVADPTCRPTGQGDKFLSTLPGSWRGLTVETAFSYTVPTCPTFSEDFKHEGPIPFDAQWENPIRLKIKANAKTGGGYCNITVGRMNFIVNSSRGISGGSTETITVIATTNSLGSTIAMTSTPVVGMTSGTDTALATATDTNGTIGRSGSGSFTFTTPQISVLPNGSTVTVTDPRNTPISQSLSAADSAKPAKMAGILGGVLGGLAIMAFVAVLLWRRRRRRGIGIGTRGRQRQEDNSSSTGGSRDSNNATPPMPLAVPSSDFSSASSNVYSSTLDHSNSNGRGNSSMGPPFTELEPELELSSRGAQSYLLQSQSPTMYSEAPPVYQSVYTQSPIM